ncbi:piggyBac transposable element-derived protein 4-like [Polistes fuscatus]|uniref:piggyBac transposable element-derived protein 4-like n=1 Tax=Polistes fuscatus TaxID=30207 RepID=UPI001CA826CD|nr:piggyBac transposable element-derived protein 4-like [Polistes fuscatus]
MSSKRKINIEYSDDIATSSSDNGSDIVRLVRKTTKQLVISDESDNEDYYQPPELWVWKKNENQPKIWQYMEIPGIKEATLDQLSTSKKEVGVFNIMFNSIFWENLVTETNLYAKQVINNGNKRRKIDEAWFPIDCDELKIYIALCIIMGDVKKSSVQMYWSKRSVIETPIFRQTMPYRRFLQISRFLHFANNKVVNRSDKLSKIKPVINYLNQKFQEIYTMQENITIDESLIKFKGRLSYKQYNPSERARFGIKVYKLCESSSENASETVVKELSKPILHKGHTLYLDNWYSSPNLFVTLLNSKTNVIGTVRANRKNMPKDFLKKKLKIGEYEMRSCNGLLAIKWKDKRDVFILSTKHTTVEMTEQIKKQHNPTWKPKQGYAEYKIKIAELLLKNTPLPNYNRKGQLSSENLPLRLQLNSGVIFLNI